MTNKKYNAQDVYEWCSENDLQFREKYDGDLDEDALFQAAYDRFRGKMDMDLIPHSMGTHPGEEDEEDYIDDAVARYVEAYG